MTSHLSGRLDKVSETAELVKQTAEHQSSDLSEIKLELSMCRSTDGALSSMSAVRSPYHHHEPSSGMHTPSYSSPNLAQSPFDPPRAFKSPFSGEPTGAFKKPGMSGSGGGGGGQGMNRNTHKFDFVVHDFSTWVGRWDSQCSEVCCGREMFRKN